MDLRIRNTKILQDICRYCKDPFQDSDPIQIGVDPISGIVVAHQEHPWALDRSQNYATFTEYKERVKKAKDRPLRFLEEGLLSRDASAGKDDTDLYMLLEGLLQVMGDDKARSEKTRKYILKHRKADPEFEKLAKTVIFLKEGIAEKLDLELKNYLPPKKTFWDYVLPWR